MVYIYVADSNGNSVRWHEKKLETILSTKVIKNRFEIDNDLIIVFIKMKINNMFIPICTNPAKYDISVMHTTTKQ